MTIQRLCRLGAAALLIVACKESPVVQENDFSGRGVPALGYAGLTAQAPTDDKIIRSATLSVQVDEVAAAIARVDTLLQRSRGLLATSEKKTSDNGRQSANLTLRVPADSLGGMMEALRALGSVRREQVSQHDVTREYVDLETRLAVKEQSLGRARELLANRTARLADVLEVEREIARLVTEIEQMKGMRRFYDDRVTYATVELQLYEAGADSARSGMTMGKALGQAFEVLSTSAACLVYLSIFVAPWLALASLVWWVVRRVRARGV